MNAPEFATKAPVRRRNLRRWVIVLGGTVIGLVLILAFPLGMVFLSGGFPPQPAPVVSTITAEAQAWRPRLEVVGTLSASTGADLAVEVAGVVEQVYFDSGGDVQAGAPLVRLRATDEIARLRTLEASAELAKATHARNEQLLEIGGISTQEVETSAATLRSAEAAVAEQRAIIEKKMVRAPFDGHLGIRNVNVGQYVNPGTVVTTLQALDPIYLDFFVPQNILERLRIGGTVNVRIDAYPDSVFVGEIATIDPKVDPATRNVAVRASLPNADLRLLPGMYAIAQIETGAEQNFITLPQTAIAFNPYGSTVFRVEERQNDAGETEFVAQQTFVTTGETRGDQIAILSGIEEGDTIVSAGQFKLQNGAVIEINNEVQPPNDPDPRPLER